MFLKAVESWIFVYTEPRQEIKLIDVLRADFSQNTNRCKNKVFYDNFNRVVEPTIWNFDILYVLDSFKIYS